MRNVWFALAMMVAAPLASPALAQDVAPAAVAALAAAPLVAAPVADSNIDPFYAARPGRLIWLQTADSRAAAAKLPEILRNAAVDGLAAGPALAATVEAALARNPVPATAVTGLADDKAISMAWVRYVQALKRPVEGISYGDPALALNPPSANTVLSAAATAWSLGKYVDQVSAVNPFYASLRESAIKSGSASDPRVRASLDRLRLLPASGRAILVDVANAQLMMLEDGRVVDTMKTVVGKPDFATPLIAGTIHYVTFNPYWHIPPDVAKRKVAPVILKRGVSYLKAARYETVAAFGGDKEVAIDPTTVDWKAVAAGTVEAHIRQLTGPNNMMGKMKFGFVNPYGIFLHDTPHKNFFALSKRNLSLGCVRLEHPEKLATWLLGHEPVAPNSDAEQNVQLDQGVPVYISYLTARPDGDTMAFAPDVYGLDSAKVQTKVAASDTASNSSSQR